MKKKIIIIIVFLLGISTGVGASIVLNANQVGYLNNDLETNNVEEALNKLYDKTKNSITNIESDNTKVVATSTPAQNGLHNFNLDSNYKYAVVIAVMANGNANINAVSNATLVKSYSSAITGFGLIKINDQNAKVTTYHRCNSGNASANVYIFYFK